jgi:hypothetical protein
MKFLALNDGLDLMRSVLIAMLCVLTPDVGQGDSILTEGGK